MKTSTTKATAPTSSKTSSQPAPTSPNNGIGQVYKASFTEYGSTDSWGSGNCQVATTACGYYTNGYNAAVSQWVFGAGPVSTLTFTYRTILTKCRAKAQAQAAVPAGDLPSRPTAAATKSPTTATRSSSKSPTSARQAATHCALRAAHRARTPTALLSTSTLASTVVRARLSLEATLAVVSLSAWAWAVRNKWTAVSGLGLLSPKLRWTGGDDSSGEITGLVLVSPWWTPRYSDL